MRLSARFLDRARHLDPKTKNSRLILDPRGIHHKIVPARSFVHAVINHADEKNNSALESLYVTKKLSDLGAADRTTHVAGQGAVFQAFRGTGDHQGCHTMPCKLVLDDRYPHQLVDGNGRMLNNQYTNRAIQLFARCTWSPSILNPIDQALDWTAESDFVTIYLNAVKAVLDGESPRDAFREFAWSKYYILTQLVERVRDEPLTPEDAVLLIAPRLSPGRAPSQKQLEQLLDDQSLLADLQAKRETVLETYLARDQVPPIKLSTGQLETEIASEKWEQRVTISSPGAGEDGSDSQDKIATASTTTSGST